MTQIESIIDDNANINDIIHNIIDLVILHSNIPANGIIDFAELGRLIRNEINSNPDFDSNIQRMCEYCNY
jgi:hypothetical protein